MLGQNRKSQPDPLASFWAVVKAGKALGQFEQRVRRRPGIPGAIICFVLLSSSVTFLRDEAHNAQNITIVAGFLLTVAWWGYVVIRRILGGLFIFHHGFIDVTESRCICGVLGQCTIH